MSLRIFVVVALVVLTFAAPVSGASLGPVANKSGNNCASRHNPQGIELWIHITKWCIVPGVRGQAQLKVQMRIHNQSSHRLYIGQDRIRVRTGFA